MNLDKREKTKEKRQKYFAFQKHLFFLSNCSLFFVLYSLFYVNLLNYIVLFFCKVFSEKSPIHRQPYFFYLCVFRALLQLNLSHYCPSIEDKLKTFSDKNTHQLFLEPEGWDTNEYYLQGFSSSLPLDIQFNALRKIPGLENVTIYRPAYAVEYDYFPPTQLNHTLELKIIVTGKQIGRAHV